jgi:hypothetical protein
MPFLSPGTATKTDTNDILVTRNNNKNDANDVLVTRKNNKTDTIHSCYQELQKLIPMTLLSHGTTAKTIPITFLSQ